MTEGEWSADWEASVSDEYAAYENAIQAIVIWATEHSYHVEFVRGGEDCICHISKTIEINSSNSLENQMMYLLHECGHALIFDNGSFLDFDGVRSNANKNSNKFKVYRVAEEIEAWKRGYKLAERLHISINDENWDKAMVSALKKYINWASN